MIEYVKHAIALVYLLTGSISDIRTREVSDWANYGLIALGFATNLIYTLSLSDLAYIIQSIFGFLIFLALALLMYYTGQWGGGDSKLLMGIGALYGFSWPNNLFLVIFIFNTLIAGAAYGMLWTIVVAIKNWKKFLAGYKKISAENKKMKLGAYLFPFMALLAAFLVSGAFLKIAILSLGILIYLTFFLWLIIKAVEISCMYKRVAPDQLTEGDWIVREIAYKGKHITGPKDLGIEKGQIAMLKKLYRAKKIGKILVKDGIPFVPSFFFGWIMAIAGVDILSVLL